MRNPHCERLRMPGEYWPPTPGSTRWRRPSGGSPSGKKRLAQHLVALLPAPQTYVEPFAGSAAVLFANKDPAKVEVINNPEPEIAEAYRMVKGLTERDLAPHESIPASPWSRVL